MDDEVYKVMVVGDCGTGKTTMLRIFVDGFSEYDESERYQFVPQTKAIPLGTSSINLFLTRNDPLGDEIPSLRKSNYEDTKCFILCYSIDRPATFDRVLTKWLPSVKEHCPNTPLILVGIRNDFRTINPDAVTTAQGKSMNKRIGAFAFVECSFKKERGIDEVFLNAAQSLRKSSYTCCCCCAF